MRATLTNRVTGASVPVTATTNHAASSYGKAVWVDADGQAYCQVGFEAPFYDVEIIEGDPMEGIAAKLDAARRAKHITIADLAERVGVSAPTVQALLAGKGNVSAATLLKVADILGVRITAE